MSTATRLTEVMRSAPEIRLDDSSKFVFFSDCHRGDNSWADDFADNQNLFFHALRYYNREKYTYFEVGDGDELWENEKFSVVRLAHKHIFWLMSEFHKEERLYLIWGNHDNERKDAGTVKRTLQCPYYDERKRENAVLFENIEVHEGIVLNYEPSGGKILVVHGHQGDLPNDGLDQISKFLVRHAWRHLQLIGIHDPTSPAESIKKRNEVEAQLVAWASANHPLIVGHTHCPMFPQKGEPPYFNDGSCVHPRCITGIEIQEGEIRLIKWSIRPIDNPPQPDLWGILGVSRDVLAGPRPLRDVFSDTRAESGKSIQGRKPGRGIQGNHVAAAAVTLGALFCFALLGELVDSGRGFKLK
jgi:UDP-2,3-diacylglucosamine pyrophosphatase LpxH